MRLAHVLWALGYSVQAVARSEEALGMARALAQPYGLAEALYERAQLDVSRREWAAARAHAEAALALAREHDFPRFVALGRFCRGAALAMNGEEALGIAEMRESLAAVQATGTALGLPRFLGQLARAHGQVGQVAEALDLLARACEMVERTAEHAFEAELVRQRGEVLLQKSPENTRAAEECFRRALDVARRQQTRSFELRAAACLAHLWQGRGRTRDARDLLSGVHGWFTEGLDAPDVREAGALLESLTRRG